MLVRRYGKERDEEAKIEITHMKILAEINYS